MDANPTTNNITQLIDNDLTGYRRLLELLREERQLLVKREFEAFTQLLATKHELLGVLDANNQARIGLLLAHALPADKEGLKTLFAGLEGEQPELAARDWKLVNELVDQCTQLNDINARIAHRAQATTHQILNMLRGDSAGFSLYGKNGTRDEHGKHLPITRV